MKLLTEYLERALQLEGIAANEQSQKFRAELLKQAKAYRTMAAQRAQQLGLPPPSTPETPS